MENQKSDLPIDLIKTVVLLFVGIPLSYLFRKINCPIRRHLYSGLVGIIMLIILLEFWAAYVFATAMVPFVFWKVFPKARAWIGCGFSIGFLLGIHIYRFMFDYESWKIDCSVPVMFLVTRVVYYALSSHSDTSLLSYVGYSFYFPSVIVGPTLSFQTYHSFMTTDHPGQKLPPMQALKPLWIGLALAPFTILGMHFFSPEWALVNPFFLSLHPIVRLFLLNFVGVFFRLKFYFAWSIAQAALNISGISWDGHSYEAVTGGSLEFQIDFNPATRIRYWSSSVHVWLKECFYTPILKRVNSVFIASMSVFVISAVWHGIYLSYYILFVHWGALVYLTKWLYRLSKNYPILSTGVFKLIGQTAAVSAVTYCGMIGVMLDWNKAITLLNGLQWSVTWGILALLPISFLIQPKRIKTDKQQ